MPVAGLVAASHGLTFIMPATLAHWGGWVYTMTNRRNGTLYVGTTVDLAGCVSENREGNIRHWPRAWKVRLIRKDNPDWDDLYDRVS